MKKCNRCNETKELSEFYSLDKESKTKGKYTYYFPYCKKCAIEKTLKERDVNRVNELSKHYYRTREKTRENRRNILRKRRQEGKYQEWQRNNPDKVKGYAEKRNNTKQHEISTREWEECKKYFNHRCAYCDLAIEEHWIVFRGNTQLGDFHRDHVNDKGANDLSNCVPACKVCNGSKHTFTLEEWYNKNNVNYTNERYSKIIKWLEEDYKLYIKIKR